MLPVEHQFSTELAEMRDVLVEDIFDTKEEIGDVVNFREEFDRPYEEFWQLSGLLAEQFKTAEEDTKGVQAAMYRGMVFGIQVVDRIRHAPLEALSTHYIASTFNNEDSATVLRGEISDYLDARPELSSLIYSFMPEIDDTYQYRYHVETSVGLVFMFCEREQAEVYLLERTKQVSDTDPHN